MYISYKTLDNTLVLAFNSYKQAKKYAEKTHLKEAEYGDVYGRNMAYCFWNKSGDRNDSEKVIAYYSWNEHGKPRNLTKEELRHYLFN